MVTVWAWQSKFHKKKKHCMLLYLFTLMQWLAGQLVAWFNELRFLPAGIGWFFSFQVMGGDISYSLTQLDVCSSLYSDLWLIIIGVQKVNNACCTSSLSHKYNLWIRIHHPFIFSHLSIYLSNICTQLLQKKLPILKYFLLLFRF